MSPRTVSRQVKSQPLHRELRWSLAQGSRNVYRKGHHLKTQILAASGSTLVLLPDPPRQRRPRAVADERQELNDSINVLSPSARPGMAWNAGPECAEISSRPAWNPHQTNPKRCLAAPATYSGVCEPGSHAQSFRTETLLQTRTPPHSGTLSSLRLRQSAALPHPDLETRQHSNSQEQ